MKQDDVIDFLFDKQEDDDLLALDDNLKDELYEKEEKLGNEIIHFIDKKVHPKSRNKLKRLIMEKETIANQCLHRENQLFYRNGVASGVQFVLTALSIK